LSLIQILRCSFSSTAILRRSRARARGVASRRSVSYAPWSHVLPGVKREKHLNLCGSDTRLN
jgi:hypothetical protein